MKLLDFTASWCGPCEAMKKAKTLETFAEKYDLELVVYDVDSKKGDTVADEYEVTSMPTLVLLGPRDKELARYVGGASLASLVRKFSKYLKEP